jgi:hypothetical protein
LDYIFISTSLRALELLRTPTSAEAGAENGGLPSSTVPSDHVPLAAVVEFVEKTGMEAFKATSRLQPPPLAMLPDVLDAAKNGNWDWLKVRRPRK